MTNATAEDAGKHSVASKVIAYLYGAAVYLGVWVILIYIVCFVGNFFGPVLESEWADVLPLKSIDMGKVEPFWIAFAINLGLLVILALQHSVMPRKFFKRFITRFVPVHLERSTFIIFAIAALSLLIWQWRPMEQVIWHVENAALRVVLDLISLGGWATVLVATFQVGHWKIFGVAQVMDYIQDKKYTRDTYATLSPEYFKVGWPFSDTGLWRYARHPDFFGFCVAFWVTPTMTAGHLMFAVGLTIYIMIGIFLLERNFSELYGKIYDDYVRGRSKLIPWFVRKSDN